jgi:hypothetical protein
MADPLANILAERGALTFNQAFAAARARGETTFRWQDPKTGKVQTYTTARADDRPAPRVNNAMLEQQRDERLRVREMGDLPDMPPSMPQKDRDLWQYFTPEARANRINEYSVNDPQAMAADARLIARVGQQQADEERDLWRQEGERRLAAERAYEEREAREGAINERFYPLIFQAQDLEKQARNMIAERDLRRFAMEEAQQQAIEDAATEAYRREQYQNQLRAQALQPVYPEALLPLYRGFNALRGLFSRRAPAPSGPAVEATIPWPPTVPVSSFRDPRL